MFGRLNSMTLNPEDASTKASYVDDRFPGPDPYAPLADLPKLKVGSETDRKSVV